MYDTCLSKDEKVTEAPEQSGKTMQRGWIDRFAATGRRDPMAITVCRRRRGWKTATKEDGYRYILQENRAFRDAAP